MFISALVLYFTYVYIEPQDEIEKTPEQSLTSVEVNQTIAKNQTCTAKRHYFGRVQHSQSITIASEAQGQLRVNTPFLVGKRVKRGQIIATVQSPDLVQEYQYRAKLSQFQALLQTITPVVETDYPEAEAAWATFVLETNKDTLPDMPLFNNQRFSTYLSTKNVNSLLFELKSFQSRIAKTQVTSPIDGTIARVYRTGGSSINPREPILELQGTGFSEIKVPIKKSDIPYLTRKDYTFKASDISYTATFNRVAQSFNPDNFMINCFFTLKPNQQAINHEVVDFHLQIPICENCLQVSRAALYAENRIYVVKNNTLTPHEVDVISLNPEYAYIKGIEDGTLFVNEYINTKYEGYQVARQ